MEAFLAMLVLIATGYAIVKYIDHQRTQTVKALAPKLGFTYQQAPRQHLHPSIWQSDLFTKGRNRTLKNLIQGDISNLQVSVGDYSYVTGHGKSRTTHRQTVAFIEFHQTYLPHFLLIPENIFHKIGSLIGYQDIDFDSHPEFSKRYYLKGENETAIRDCFTPQVLEFFENHGRFCVESRGSVLMYYKQNFALPPNQWKKLLNSACRVYKQF